MPTKDTKNDKIKQSGKEEPEKLKKERKAQNQRKTQNQHSP
jgi:hypothetical protein